MGAVMTLPLARRVVSSRIVGVGHLMGNRTIRADIPQSGLVSMHGSRLPQEQLIFIPHGGASVPPRAGLGNPARLQVSLGSAVICRPRTC